MFLQRHDFIMSGNDGHRIISIDVDEENPEAKKVVESKPRLININGANLGGMAEMLTEECRARGFKVYPLDVNSIGGELNWYEAAHKFIDSVDSYRGKYAQRAAYVRTFAWAVPNTDAIGKLAALGPIVEIGAGNGYWANLIRAAGGDVVCYDSWQRNVWNGDPRGGTWHPVKTGGPRMVARHQDRALLLIWAELWQRSYFYTDWQERELAKAEEKGDLAEIRRHRAAIRKSREAEALYEKHRGDRGWRGNMEYRAIKKYDGSTIALVGETNWGCTGCTQAKDLLEEKGFEQVDEVFIPVWDGIHDSLQIYRR